MVHHQLPVGLWGAKYKGREGGGYRIHRNLGHAKSTLERIRIVFTKNEAYADMSERLVINLAIEEAI